MVNNDEERSLTTALFYLHTGMGKIERILLPLYSLVQDDGKGACMVEVLKSV